MYLYAIGKKIVLDAGKVSFLEMQVIASNFKNEPVYLMESYYENSISIMFDDFFYLQEFEKTALGTIVYSSAIEALTRICGYDDFNSQKDISLQQSEWGGFDKVAKIKFKGIAQEFQVILDEEYQEFRHPSLDFQAKDIEKYFTDWELV